MIKEFKEYYKMVGELKRIRKEINDNTKRCYEEIIETLYELSDDLWGKVDESYRDIPVLNTRTIKKCNPDELDEITKGILLEKPLNEDIRYKYGYFYRYNDEPALLIDFDLLKEHFEPDDFNVRFQYDNKPEFGDTYDTVEVSMYYDNLKEFRNKRQK